jgi:hypothetical protein
LCIVKINKYIDNSVSYKEYLVQYLATLLPYIEELVSYTCNAKINLDIDTLISYTDDMILDIEKMN